jgi:hypothetical protein
MLTRARPLGARCAQAKNWGRRWCYLRGREASEDAQTREPSGAPDIDARSLQGEGDVVACECALLGRDKGLSARVLAPSEERGRRCELLEGG